MEILHLISLEKCQVWHKPEVNSADLRIERDIINKFKEWKLPFNPQRIFKVWILPILVLKASYRNNIHSIFTTNSILSGASKYHQKRWSFHFCGVYFRG